MVCEKRYLKGCIHKNKDSVIPVDFVFCHLPAQLMDDMLLVQHVRVGMNVEFVEADLDQHTALHNDFIEECSERGLICSLVNSFVTQTSLYVCTIVV